MSVASSISTASTRTPRTLRFSLMVRATVVARSDRGELRDRFRSRPGHLVVDPGVCPFEPGFEPRRRCPTQELVDQRVVATAAANTERCVEHVVPTEASAGDV